MLPYEQPRAFQSFLMLWPPAASKIVLLDQTGVHLLLQGLCMSLLPGHDFFQFLPDSLLLPQVCLGLYSFPQLLLDLP